MSFVRSSKYRHVFGTAMKKEQCYEDLRPGVGSADSNPIAASSKFFSLTWKSSGGGAVLVVPFEKTGRVAPNSPMIVGHRGAVLDMAWSPFNDNLLATASEDATVKLWAIPEGGLTENATEPLVTLSGHSRKVNVVCFHPTANNVVATASYDHKVKVWDAEKGAEILSIDGHGDVIQSIAWNYNGSLIATSCKDKKIRVIDPRTGEIVAEGKGHEGTKSSRILWAGNRDRLITVGFSRQSERQYAVWDAKDLSKPLTLKGIDVSSGALLPFFDADTGVLFIVGKGDGNVRYFEYVDEKPYLHYLADFRDKKPQIAGNVCPKRAVDVSSTEIVRMLKVTADSVVPIKFCVPRKTEIFQEDVYPDTPGPMPALSASEWFGGENKDPVLMSMKPGEQVEAQATFEKKKTYAELEAEVAEKDAKIAELEAKLAELSAAAPAEAEAEE